MKQLEILEEKAQEKEEKRETQITSSSIVIILQKPDMNMRR